MQHRNVKVELSSENESTAMASMRLAQNDKDTMSSDC